MDHNRIPRNFNRITAKSLLNTSGGAAGDVWHVYKNFSGYCGLNINSGKYFYIPAATLRNKSIYQIIAIE